MKSARFASYPYTYTHAGVRAGKGGKKMHGIQHDMRRSERHGAWAINIIAGLGLALGLSAVISTSIGDAHTLQPHGGVIAQAAPGPVGLSATTVLQTTTTAVGQPVQFPQTRNQWTAVMLEIAPGGRVGRHQHPVPNLVYVLEGEITVEADGHPTRTYRQGQAFAESVNHWHDGLNRGATPVRVLVVFAGEEGVSVTVRP